MASAPITFMVNRRGKGGSSDRFPLSGPKITEDDGCSHEIKRWLLLGRKTMINLESVLKSKDITLLTKICIVKAMIFPVVMYGYKSWTIKKAECQRIDAFKLQCWRRLLDSKKVKPVNPKGNQSWIVRKHLTRGFPCAVLDLSGTLWPLLIPEYSGIKRRGMPFPGAKESRHFSLRW